MPQLSFLKKKEKKEIKEIDAPTDFRKEAGRDLISFEMVIRGAFPEIENAPETVQEMATLLEKYRTGGADPARVLTTMKEIKEQTVAIRNDPEAKTLWKELDTAEDVCSKYIKTHSTTQAQVARGSKPPSPLAEALKKKMAERQSRESPKI
ncbi:MAG: hypothetical protein ACD_21C00195G0003 [uncultured bacterium]|nr:MAG: hypothetical protein ACD_21C00195G0003 [uncultured bacterium]